MCGVVVAAKARFSGAGSLGYEGVISPVVRKVPHCPLQLLVQSLELLQRLLAVLLG